jgi:hypothetical protein
MREEEFQVKRKCETAQCLLAELVPESWDSFHWDRVRRR